MKSNTIFIIYLCVYTSKNPNTDESKEREKIRKFTLQTGAMSERSSPTDFVGEMLRGAAEELGASALTLRSPAIISYKIF